MCVKAPPPSSSPLLSSTTIDCFLFVCFVVAVVSDGSVSVDGDIFVSVVAAVAAGFVMSFVVFNFPRFFVLLLLLLALVVVMVLFVVGDFLLMMFMLLLLLLLLRLLLLLPLFLLCRCRDIIVVYILVYFPPGNTLLS